LLVQPRLHPRADPRQVVSLEFIERLRQIAWTKDGEAWVSACRWGLWKGNGWGRGQSSRAGLVSHPRRQRLFNFVGPARRRLVTSRGCGQLQIISSSSAPPPPARRRTRLRRSRGGNAREAVRRFHERSRGTFFLLAHARAGLDPEKAFGFVTGGDQQVLSVRIGMTNDRLSTQRRRHLLLDGKQSRRFKSRKQPIDGVRP